MTKSQELKQLRPNPKNPRKITDKKLKALRAALDEFGDLSGIVVNKRTGQIVGGTQRARAFDIGEAQIEVHAYYHDIPSKTGTILEGYAIIDGERFAYREVDWDETREKAANIAANKGAGEWDSKQLGEWMRELDALNWELDLTMFDEKEREKFLGGKSESDAKKGERLTLSFETDEFEILTKNLRDIMINENVSSYSAAVFYAIEDFVKSYGR